MGVSDEREPVEVELVVDGDDASPFSPRSAATVGTSDAAPPPPGRAAAVAVGVGVVALVLGWVLGRAGGDGPPEPVVAVRATVADVTEPVDPVATIATAPPRWTRATTTVAASDGSLDTGGNGAGSGGAAAAVSAVVETEVELAGALQGQPIEIVAYGNGRQLFELDLTTSVLRSRDVATQPFGRARLLVAPDWSLFPSSDPTFPSTFVPRDGVEREVEVGPSWQIVGVADGGSLWSVFPPPDADLETVVQRRTVGGELLDELAFVPAPPVRVDPAGGVVVEVPGATTAVLPQPATTSATSGGAEPSDPVLELLTTGRLLALGVDLAVAEECDPELRCSLVRVDRATGERSELERPGDGGLLPYAIVGSSSIAPDGDRAVVEVLDPFDRASTQRRLGILDLSTGAVTEIGPAQDVDEAVWTPDGRFVLFIEGGRVVAHEPASATTFPVIDELVAINAFAVRPVAR